MQGSVVIGGITSESVQQALELAVGLRGSGEQIVAPNDYLQMFRLRW